MRWAEWRMFGGCEKNRAACIFLLASCARIAYKNFTEAIKPGFEELAR